jgi:hypothetical protein
MQEETLQKRLEKFQCVRLEHMRSDKHRIIQTENGQFVAHIIPADAFDLASQYRFTEAPDDSSSLRPMSRGGLTVFPVFEGWVHASGHGSDEDYTLLFRNGIIEAVNASALRPYNDKYIATTLLLEGVCTQVSKYLAFLQESAILPPFYLAISMISVEGYRLPNNPARFSSGKSMNRSDLILPPIIIERQEDIRPALKILFDAIWNAFGEAKCYDFDQLVKQ